MERVKGIEPSFQAWEAHVLPLNHTRAQNYFYQTPALRAIGLRIQIIASSLLTASRNLLSIKIRRDGDSIFPPSSSRT
jgi:hypothetical protein